MADELGVHINSILGILKKLVELNIVVKEKKKELIELLIDTLEYMKHLLNNYNYNKSSLLYILDNY